ncbi:MAG: hypothetical protein GF313_12575 [Caldithrix sp.]|nr:hypothetical protein [Caldithrix sp.]
MPDRLSVLMADAITLYKGFYIESPVGNNAFSWEKRRQKSIWVPPLQRGKLSNLASGDKVVFSEIDEKVEQQCIGLYQFVLLQDFRIPIFVFDNHNHAFFFWWLLWKAHIIEPRTKLVHIDQHSDMREPPHYFNPNSENVDLKKAFENTNYMLNVGNFIQPALQTGIFTDVLMIDSSVRFELQPSGPCVLDVDMDIFAAEMNYINTNYKIVKIREWIKRADAVTIATSPYFMDQPEAISLIRDIFSTMDTELQTN